MTGAGAPDPAVARIGPNAITQLVGVLDHCEGPHFRDAVMSRAGVVVPDPAAGMIPEGDAAAVHHALRALAPARAETLLRSAGLATGSYILRHRIPRAAQLLIRALPAGIAARVLSGAITRHSWTFAGSGGFRVAGWHPLTFEVTQNPLVAGLQADHPLCHWHAAVFERLFAHLVWPGCRVHETACRAAGATLCRFEVDPCPDRGRPAGFGRSLRVFDPR
ncbi:bacteriochlorophyll 4-vinyl reductase [Paragemmobacter ruber]|uniref:Bacteriochlorophyll 4-vinyl reductase n=1 Tax=Paragemmobacter ruber TaxID=1985673 RepID=A0ABW9Y8W3_9RHOB|nr:bacteriochlorophyll 4-vinyl reductase [Rhodobacter ruber]NBE08272.1 bacteriochlorophyll 4-vinyl reductase [Rhodobacter ruber]